MMPSRPFFIVIMDSLCKLFEMARSVGFCTLFRNKHSIPQGSSVYVDDVIVFLIAKHNDVDAAKLLLEIFVVLRV